MSETRLVKYFFVGVGKCGTSWIYEFLGRRNLIAVPVIKEPYLIDAPADERAGLVDRLYSPDPGQDMADFSNVYYWDTQNPEKIHAYNPAAKIIVTTRKPSERIVSHFGFMRRNGEVPQDRLEEYLDADDAHAIVARSRYRDILDRYIRVFGRDNVLLLPLEELSEDPQRYADRLADFMGVPRVVLEEEDRMPVLKAAAPRSRLVARTAKKTANLMRSMNLLPLLGRFKRAKIIRTLLFKAAAPPTDIAFGRATEEIHALDADYPALLRDYGP